jgi:hypothetical protein
MIAKRLDLVSLALLAGAALAFGGASGCSAKDACGGCGTAQICDASSKTCQPAIAFGQPCLDGDGGPLALPCQEGTSCETALSPAVCGQSCDPSAQSTCPSGDQCWTLSDDAGTVVNSQGLPLGFCGPVSDAGESCGVIGLSFCDPNQNLACVGFESAVDGVCFEPCDPTASPDACPAPTECLAVFADPTQGICWTSVAQGSPCEEAALLFCPQNQLCLDPGDGGSCWVRCTPGDSTSCPVEGESCVTPTTDQTVGLCANAVASGAVCDPQVGEFCGSTDFCITADGGGTTCHQECTTADPTCPAGQTCLQISGGNGLMACG